MTENPLPDLADTLFERIEAVVHARGADIRTERDGKALRLGFADGGRIVINLDAHSNKVWLASAAGGSEFELKDGVWRAHDHNELLQRLSALIDQALASASPHIRATGSPARQHAESKPQMHDAAPQKNHRLRNLFLLALAVMAGFWLAQRHAPASLKNETDSATNIRYMTAEPSVSTRQCESSLPANGSIHVFSKNLRTDGPNDAEVTLQNDHAYPLLLILAEPRTVIPALSVLVHARQTTSLHLPSGEYEILFSAGNTWCDPRNGFSDGHLMKFDKTLTAQIGIPMQLAMRSSGADVGDFQLFVKMLSTETPPPPTFSGDGSMTITRQANGHFYVPGSVANVPATFLVDTGASVTSISDEIARQAGLHNCKEMQFNTANGMATGCIALVPNMTLGNFTLQNITVAVMPNMETNLLGANVLRNFQVSQSDSLMLIGRK
jgi:iron donor protein CyaY